MSPWLETYLTPSKASLQFATKTTLAMLLALYIALWCDLDRPYWALISAAFLQIRPMSGMVVEKGICQIGGTLIGALVGIVIMAFFAQARVPALIALTLWIMFCTYGSSLLRNNFSYGCIMGAVTAMLIVVISANQPPSGIFDIAVARLSELGLGALCATLVSALLWPTRVKDHLANQADEVINQAFTHASQRLDAGDAPEAMQQSLTASLEPLTMLETDSQAARYEGPDGNGRMRATHVLTRRTLRFFATLGALYQLLHDHRERISTPLHQLASEIADGFRNAEHVKGVPAARQQLLELRKRAHAYTDTQLDPLQRRVILALREVLGHAMIMLDAREAIAHPGRKQLRGGSLSWHRDHLVALLNAGRAGLVFSCLAIFWLQTDWSNGQVAMLLGTLFSAFFATRDNPVTICMMFFKGMLAALPSAFLFGHVLLSQANGFPMLAMLVITPLFLGMLGASNPRLMGYCLAFTIFNILLTMPGNGMDFSFDSFANRALAVIVGLSAVVMGFRLFPGLGAPIRRRRLIGAISHDLRHIDQQPLHEAESRFSGRMADRLLQLARHDDMLPEDHRHLFMIGLNGLDLGRSCLRLRHRLDDAPAPVRDAMQHLLDTLAVGFEDSAHGRSPLGLKGAGQALDDAIERHGGIEEDARELLEGLIERLVLVLERQAEVMAEHQIPDTATPKTA
ncbi:FUSC family protein [Chromohalobacter canadensis]|uniref:FUSC family protein n=1 Tax=Chromohalobacter moromii TaxID=2860329 RepID=A0A9X3B383_9GAMM|nr:MULTISPECIES: FUSC family protein [Chromohalobacter]MCT8468619.1 FUSC family protein [Chromohalobacter canadensis]MCT8471674.1 FUSC family protein [Chromohalobacter canadensis]MCT8499127.1 FUSC family protein [Chromohalobacter canadensis]MCT8505005.1 FUSC family protein [Chromohalobacter moromii]